MIVNFTITREEFEQICNVIGLTIPVINRNLPAGKGPQTGVWVLATNELTNEHYIRLVGTLPGEGEEALCYGYAREKDARLEANPGHLTTRRTRDPESGQFIGGVRVQVWRISASGLIEECDEAAILFALLVVKQLPIEEIGKIIGDTFNDEMEEVLRWLCLFFHELVSPMMPLILKHLLTLSPIGDA